MQQHKSIARSGHHAVNGAIEDRSASKNKVGEETHRARRDWPKESSEHPANRRTASVVKKIARQRELQRRVDVHQGYIRSIKASIEADQKKNAAK